MDKLDKKLVHELETHLDPVKARKEIMEANEESTDIYKYIDEAERSGWQWR